MTVVHRHGLPDHLRAVSFAVDHARISDQTFFVIRAVKRGDADRSDARHDAEDTHTGKANERGHSPVSDAARLRSSAAM